MNNNKFSISFYNIVHFFVCFILWIIGSIAILYVTPVQCVQCAGVNALESKKKTKCYIEHHFRFFFLFFLSLLYFLVNSFWLEIVCLKFAKKTTVKMREALHTHTHIVDKYLCFVLHNKTIKNLFTCLSCCKDNNLSLVKYISYLWLLSSFKIHLFPYVNKLHINYEEKCKKWKFPFSPIMCLVL